MHCLGSEKDQLRTAPWGKKGPFAFFLYAENVVFAHRNTPGQRYTPKNQGGDEHYCTEKRRRGLQLY
jgi:hypothetical protein